MGSGPRHAPRPFLHSTSAGFGALSPGSESFPNAIDWTMMCIAVLGLLAGATASSSSMRSFHFHPTGTTRLSRATGLAARCPATPIVPDTRNGSPSTSPAAPAAPAAAPLGKDLHLAVRQLRLCRVMLLLQERFSLVSFVSFGLGLLMILKFRLFMSLWLLMILELHLLSLWLLTTLGFCLLRFRFLSFLHHDSTILRYLSLQLTLVMAMAMTTTRGFSYANINDNCTNQGTKGHLQHLECCKRPIKNR
mmetsp:Transcript_62971/g.99935  ORF Transcript_62971/g.99935 Transcript_62971/m.99935 type:complete len:249 (-) Transcript_62971:68-814(-)